MGVKGLDTTKDCAGHKKISEEPSPQTNLETAKKNFLDIKALVRSIQRAEGSADCFRMGIVDCDQVDCKWHQICLEG
jgi:hypothetical protein